MQSINKRLLSVTIVGCIFLATGIIGSVFHATELKAPGSARHDAVWALLVSLVAILCGIYLLRGSDWARWLAVAWLVFHVLLSLYSRQALVIHSALLVVIAYLLFRRAAGTYFRAAAPSDGT